MVDLKIPIVNVRGSGSNSIPTTLSRSRICLTSLEKAASCPQREPFAFHLLEDKKATSPRSQRSKWMTG